MSFKCTVKTLKKESFEVELAQSDTILDVKKKIHQVRPDMDVELQRLVFAGKELKDEQSVSEAQIASNANIVVMLRKAPVKTGAGPSQPAAVVEQPAQPVAPQATTPAAQPMVTPTPTAAAQPAAPAQPVAQPAAAPRMSEEAERTIISLMEITGKNHDECTLALRAAYMNADRAVEYLFSGIPPQVLNQIQAAAAQPPQARPTAPVQGQPPQQQQQQQVRQQPAQPQSGGALGLGAIANHPQFVLLRHLVQQEPALREPMLQDLVNNPQIGPLVEANRAEVERMLQEPLTPEQLEQVQRMTAMMGAVPGDEEGEEGDDEGMPMDMDQGGQHVIQLTPDEAAAVHRLMELGFTEEVALEAYLVCEKNEQMAANMLFTQQGMP